MIPQESDALVLAALREAGPGTAVVKYLAEKTGLARVTVRTSVTALVIDGLVCLVPDCGESRYLVRHLHAGPGGCTEPLAREIQEVHPDGQR